MNAEQGWDYGLSPTQRKLVIAMVENGAYLTPKIVLATCPKLIPDAEAMQIAYGFHLLQLEQGI